MLLVVLIIRLQMWQMPQRRTKMDKNYWQDVLKARKEIYDMMIALGVSSVRSTDSINPFYNQIIDNGGIGLEFYYNKPNKLYTPLGYIDITCHFTCGGKEEDIINKLISDYGVVLVEKLVTNSYGAFGPVYAITKLPWAPGKQLPIFEYKNYEDYLSYSEAKNLYAEFEAES